MEMKQSKSLTFYKRQRTVFVQLPNEMMIVLIPLRGTDGQLVRHIWNVAESIEDYCDLIRICKPEHKVRPEYTQWKPQTSLYQ
jgi:hypothetical protein